MPWHLSVARSRRLPPPAGFHRTLSADPRRLPAGLSWLHEMKHDGFRILARKQRRAEPLWAVLRAPRPPTVWVKPIIAASPTPGVVRPGARRAEVTARTRAAVRPETVS
jgi:hypothetical protein